MSQRLQKTRGSVRWSALLLQTRLIECLWVQCCLILKTFILHNFKLELLNHFFFKYPQSGYFVFSCIPYDYHFYMSMIREFEVGCFTVRPSKLLFRAYSLYGSPAVFSVPACGIQLKMALLQTKTLVIMDWVNVHIILYSIKNFTRICWIKIKTRIYFICLLQLDIYNKANSVGVFCISHHHRKGTLKILIIFIEINDKK